MIQFQETPAQTTGWKHGKTIFHRTLLTTAGGPTSKTAVDWHLKVKRYKVGCRSNQNLLHHSQHTQNQLNSHTHF